MNPPLQTAAQLLHSLEQRRQRALLPTRVPAFDRLLAGGQVGGGLARGTLVELAGGRSSGRFGIALAALAAATRSGEAAAIVDLGDHFDPRSAEGAGVDLRRLLWVRPRSLKQAAMAAETVLSAGFTLVVLDLGAQPVSLSKVPPSVWVRLARAAEAHHAVLLLISPAPVRTPAAACVLLASAARAVWQAGSDVQDRHGAGAPPPLLSGIASRLSVLRRQQGLEGAPLDAGGFQLGVRDDIGWLEGA